MDDPALLAGRIDLVHELDHRLMARRHRYLADGLSDRLEVWADRSPRIVHPLEAVGRASVERHGVHASSPVRVAPTMDGAGDTYADTESRPRPRSLIVVPSSGTGPSPLDDWESVGQIIARLRQ